MCFLHARRPSHMTLLPGSMERIFDTISRLLSEALPMCVTACCC